MTVETTPDRVRGELDVTADQLPSEEDDSVDEKQPLDYQIEAAVELVSKRLDVAGGIDSDGLLGQIATLVAADFAFSTVTGEAKGRKLTAIGDGDANYEFANSSANAATGNSSHWQEAVKLDYTGRLDSDQFASYTPERR